MYVTAQLIIVLRSNCTYYIISGAIRFLLSSDDTNHTESIQEVTQKLQ